MESLFLVGVFFFVTQDVFFTVTDEISTADRYAAVAESGAGSARRAGIVVIGLYGLFGLMKRDRNSLAVRGTMGWLLAIFVVLIVVSVLWSHAPVFTLRRSARFLALFLAALAVAARFSVYQISLFAYLGSGASLLMGLVSEVSLGTFRIFDEGYRFSGTCHPNLQGMNCALLLISSLSLAQKDSSRRHLYLFSALAALGFLFLTRSRTAFAASIVTAAFYLAISMTGRQRAGNLAIVGVGVSTFIMMFGETAMVAGRYLLTLGRDESHFSTLSRRVPLWAESLEYAFKKPILGYGYDSFWTADMIWAFSSTEGWGIPGAHSGFIEILLSLGFVGLLLFVVMWILGINRSGAYYIKSKEHGYLFAASLLILVALDGLLESVFSYLYLPSFLALVILAKLSFDQTEFRSLAPSRGQRFTGKR
jgi:O-antigen ligase